MIRVGHHNLPNMVKDITTAHPWEVSYGALAMTDKVPQTLTYSWAGQSSTVGAYSLHFSAYSYHTVSYHIAHTSH